MRIAGQNRTAMLLKCKNNSCNFAFERKLTMTDEERDELLIELKITTRHTHDLIERQEKHLDELNGQVAKHSTDLAVLYDRDSPNTQSIVLSRRQAVVGGSAILAVIAALFQFGNSMGWW